MHRSFGLTGGIASGKSTVARFLEALGAKVIDADRVGHELLQSSNPIHHKVVSHFGQEILESLPTRRNSAILTRSCIPA
jgi:dephospho-CoA kinase